MKILTDNIEKGGTGKTTITHNLAGYSASVKGLRVLLIDQDKSKNLSSRFSNILQQKHLTAENTINNLYLGKEVRPLNLMENIDILISADGLNKMDSYIKDQPNNRLILFSWIVQNHQELEKKYDLIIIDTHNDTDLLVQNAWAISDVILGISDPSRDGFEALQALGVEIEKLRSALTDVRTGEQYMIAKYYQIGNKVEHNTKSSKEFKEMFFDVPNYLGYIQKKELMHTTSLDQVFISDYAKDRKTYHDNKSFFVATYALFDVVLNKLGFEF